MTAIEIDHISKKYGRTTVVDDLTDAARREVRGYSMGMRQRVSVEGAMLVDREVLIFDEPLNGLDPEGMGWLRDTVKQFAAGGRTVLLSRHLLGEVAATVDDVVI